MWRATAVAMAGIALLAGCERSPPITKSKAQVSSDTAASQAPATAADLGKAFVATFNMPAPAVVPQANSTADEDPVQFTPQALFQLSPGLWVLISEGTIKDGAHVQYGQLAVSYLTKKDDSYQVVGRWLDVGGGGPFGQVAQWKVRYDLAPNPVIWTTVEDGGMGCQATYHDIISLMPNKAQRSAETIITESSYDGDGDRSRAWKITSTLVPGNKPNAFEIRYTGKVSSVAHYQYVLDGYMQSDGPSKDQLNC